MKRTRISLSLEDYKLATEEARRLGVSLAEFFRRSLRKNLPIDRSKPWMRFCGFVGSGIGQSGKTLDEVVYLRKN